MLCNVGFMDFIRLCSTGELTLILGAVIVGLALLNIRNVLCEVELLSA